MGQFDENSELERILKVVKAHNLTFDDVCEKIGINRAKFNNTRRLNNAMHKEELVNLIKTNFPNLNFEVVAEIDSEQTYQKMFIAHLLEENHRLKVQIDLLIKKLLENS